MLTRRGMLGLLASTAAFPAFAATVAEVPFLAEEVAAGRLPPMAERLPRNPRVLNLPQMGRQTGRHGGTVRMLIGGQRDIRLVPINSYARLVGYDEMLALHPDILASVEVEENRSFTLRLRDGHRWSDGSPFTAEDFRYVWDEVWHHPELGRGSPQEMWSGAEEARFEVLDPATVRYVFARPTPDFLPRLAAPLPLVLALPFTYLRQFHADHRTPEDLARLIAEQRVDDWTDLHTKMSRQTRPENPDLPTLEAWCPRTLPPAEQFVFARNPYFHRVDQVGNQLPYIDRFVLNVASFEIITAKTATGESDLQISAIGFGDYTLLKRAEQNYPQKVSLWKRAQGSAVALLPNLNCNDPVWRALFRDVRVRRALSLAIDREEINKVIFFGLGRASANTVLPDSPLYRDAYSLAWAAHDPDQANALLDAAGLDQRDTYDRRLLPDGRLAGIVVETAGESSLETDVLELITDHFRAVGLQLYIRGSQRDIFRSRAMAGMVTMSVWQGLNNGVPTADMSPAELAPTMDDQLQWPFWGVHYLSGGTTGEAPDMPEVQQMLALLGEWKDSTTTEAREAIWHRMLTLHAEQVFSIGTVSGALQPIVRRASLRNVPEQGLYGFEPTSYLGVYLPDTFWYEEA